jgi:hypothetical protein
VSKSKTTSAPAKGKALGAAEAARAAAERVEIKNDLIRKHRKARTVGSLVAGGRGANKVVARSDG